MVLIKDMGIPYNCARCRLRDAEHSECKVAWKRVGIYGVDYTTGRPKWCPLDEVEPLGKAYIRSNGKLVPQGRLYKEK